MRQQRIARIMYRGAHCGDYLFYGTSICRGRRPIWLRTGVGRNAPTLQAAAHAVDVAAAPVDLPAQRAMAQINLPGGQGVGDRGLEGRRERRQLGVADDAAGERPQEPVDPKAPGDLGDAILEGVGPQHDDRAESARVLGKLPIARHQDAALPERPGQQVAIALAAAGNQRVVAGGAQPAAEALQHLVAQQLRRERVHGYIPLGSDVARLEHGADMVRTPVK